MSCCTAAMPVLPDFQLPKLNRAGNGTLKIVSTKSTVKPSLSPFTHATAMKFTAPLKPDPDLHDDEADAAAAAVRPRGDGHDARGRRRDGREAAEPARQRPRVQRARRQARLLALPADGPGVGPAGRARPPEGDPGAVRLHRPAGGARRPRRERRVGQGGGR